MKLTRRRIAIILGIGAALGVAFELIVTGGTIDAPLDRLAIYYATAFPWATIFTVLVQFFIVEAGYYPEGIDPLIIGLAGGIQGAILGGIVLLLLIPFSLRAESKRSAPEL
ncbi:hypothetical protein ACIG47_19390 [Promicromonospora sp. NPDC052451]|uniref:hypothetical protein n=1 Tax=Promicromonospora sp. NPDC052451 TaxID=3364407 RepID=UPI0037C771C7